MKLNPSKTHTARYNLHTMTSFLDKNEVELIACRDEVALETIETNVQAMIARGNAPATASTLLSKVLTAKTDRNDRVVRAARLGLSKAVNDESVWNETNLTIRELRQLNADFWDLASQATGDINQSGGASASASSGAQGRSDANNPAGRANK